MSSALRGRREWRSSGAAGSVDYTMVSNPTDWDTTRPWLPGTADEEKALWLARAKQDAAEQGLPFGKVAWLFRLLYGEYPSTRVSNMARRLRRGAE